MSPALSVDVHDLVLDLHALVRDLDPARWRDDFESVLRERSRLMRQRLDAWEQRMSQDWERFHAEESWSTLRENFRRISGALDEYQPSVGLSGRELRREWRVLGKKLAPLYASVAATLRLADIHVPELRPTNYLRNVFHVGCAVLSVGLVELVLGDRYMIHVALTVAVLAWFLEITRRFSKASDRFSWWLFGRMAHPHERHRINSATWYSTSLLVLSLTHSALVASLALAVLGVADPAAALVGRRFGRHPLVHGRTVEGTLSFIGAGLLASLLVLRVWHADLGWGAALLLATAAVLPAAWVELRARKWDDNLLIPLTAAGSTSLVALMIGAF